MTTRDRVSVALPSATLDPSSIAVGTEVEAWDGSEEVEKFWSARVVRINHTSTGTTYTVKFFGYGCVNEIATVSLEKLRPEGWTKRKHLVPTSEKRTRSVQSFAVDAAHDSDSDSVLDNAATPRRAATPKPPGTRKRRCTSNGEEVVERIYSCQGEGDERVYHTLMASGKFENLPRSAFFQTDKDGIQTVTGALLAFEWVPSRIVQTYNNGAELLVSWANRPPQDWARIPAVAFHPSVLALLRAPQPPVAEKVKLAAAFRIYWCLQRALRRDDKKAQEGHFSAEDIESVLGGLGIPVPDSKREFGDRVWYHYTREELDPIFRQFREKWDEVRNSKGKLHGKVEFEREPKRGVHIRWYARPATIEIYESREGLPAYAPAKTPTPYIEMMEIKVVNQLSTAEQDLAAIAPRAADLM